MRVSLNKQEVVWPKTTIKVLLILILSLVASILINAFDKQDSSVRAQWSNLTYKCPTGYYCSPDSGILQGPGVWARDRFGDCRELTRYIQLEYSCSGTDDSCTGGIYWWESLYNCENNIDPMYAGCCNWGEPPCDPTPCTPTCPTGSSTVNTAGSVAVDASCTNDCGDKVPLTCYYPREDLCNATSISDEWIKSGETTTMTSIANTNVNYFYYVFYNKATMGVICRSYLAGWATTQGSCPAGSYELIVRHYYATAKTTDTLVIPANNVFVSDARNGGTVVKDIQINGYFIIDGRAFSLAQAECVESVSHCTPLCTPNCVSPLTSSVTSFGTTTVSCNNIPAECGTESGICYCTDCMQNCPIQLSNTPFVLTPNLILSGFRNCTNQCGVSSVADCHEIPSVQPDEGAPSVISAVTNTYGFKSLTHVGKPLSIAGNLNDPIKYSIDYYDSDDGNVEAMFVWFRGNQYTGEPGTPLWISTSSLVAPQSPSYDSWGFMMHYENNTWVPYVPSYGVVPAVWKKAQIFDIVTNTFAMYSPVRTGMILVSVPLNKITHPDFNVTAMEFTLKFTPTNWGESSVLNTSYPPTETKYKILSMGLDKFSFTPYDNYPFSVAAYWSPNQLRYRSFPEVAQTYARQWTDTGKTLTIDKQVPSIVVSKPTVSGNIVSVKWTATDIPNAYSNIYSIVGNIYSDAGAYASRITLLPSPFTANLAVSAPFVPTSEDGKVIGHLTTGWAFKAPAFSTINSSTHSGEIMLNIGDNKVGNLKFYITVFDDAGNMATGSTILNLEDWIVTDGGVFYSKDGIGFVGKELSTSIVWNDGSKITILPPVDKYLPLTETLTPSNADLTSETIAKGYHEGEWISPLIKESATGSYSVKDFIGHIIPDFYNTLYTAYTENIESIPDLHTSVWNKTLPSLTAMGCGKGENCVFTSIEDVTLLNFSCDAKALVFINGNLIINGNVITVRAKEIENQMGCIFVVSGNVNILGGDNASPSSFAYDQLNAYILANGTITIGIDKINAITGLTDYNQIQDGLYINGGLQSFGGITINRSLRLADRMNFPAVAIDYHSKYAALGGIFFKNNFSMQKIETGFKP